MAKKKTAKKATKKTAKKATKKTAKKATKKSESKKATKKTAKKTAAKKSSKKTRARSDGPLWRDRFSTDRTGPWICPNPKCGPLPSHRTPLYGEDEKHHCPNIGCDEIVSIPLEDVSAQRRGSWPPQRKKKKKDA